MHAAAGLLAMGVLSQTPGPQVLRSLLFKEAWVPPPLCSPVKVEKVVRAVLDGMHPITHLLL